MREALESIANFPDMQKCYEYLEMRGVKFNTLLPPYLIMVQVANAALAGEREGYAGSIQTEGRLPGMSIDSGQTL